MDGIIDKYMKCTGGGRGSSSAIFTAQEQLQPANLVYVSRLLNFHSLFIIYLFLEFFSLIFGIDC